LRDWQAGRRVPSPRARASSSDRRISHRINGRFLSIAYDLHDRFADASGRSAAMSSDGSRTCLSGAYEIVSLMNVDHCREHRRDPLAEDQLRAHPIAGDGIDTSPICGV
jgi:hypothetical protein